MNASITPQVTRQFSRVKLALQKKLRLPIRHHYENFSILLPAEHLLPVYQRQHPRYDRFLPHLVEALGAGAAIIDVGANCGDTLAGMVERNPKATYVCIEPDAEFFAYLKINIARMKSSFGQLSIHVVKALVGKTVGEVTLAGGGGSRHAVVAETAAGGHSSATLDNILTTLPPLSVDLLKSDVDGFDFDVIDSAEALLNSQHPVLFFETQCDNKAQLAGFVQTIGRLEALGYRHWTAFDNFGTIVLRTSESSLIIQLLDYVWKQRQGATRTIYYLDILVCSDARSRLIDEVLDRYQSPLT